MSCICLHLYKAEPCHIEKVIYSYFNFSSPSCCVFPFPWRNNQVTVSAVLELPLQKVCCLAVHCCGLQPVGDVLVLL